MGLFNWAKEVIKDTYTAQIAATKENIADKQTADRYGDVMANVVAGNALIPAGEVLIIKGKIPRTLQFNIKGTRHTYSVVAIAWQEKKEASASKAVGTAVVGGILTGGVVGLLAGAAYGARKKDTSTAVLTLEVNGQQQPLYLRCNAQDYEKLSKMIYA